MGVGCRNIFKKKTRPFRKKRLMSMSVKKGNVSAKNPNKNED